MIPLIITILIFVILSIYIIARFMSNFLFVVLSLILLWAVSLRSYYEISNKRIIRPYFISLAVTSILFLFWFEVFTISYVFWPVWFITIMFIIAKLVEFGMIYYNQN